MTSDDLLSLHISTSAFPAKDATEAFREIFAKAILQIEMEPLGGQELEVDMVLRGLPDFGMATGWSSPGRYPHTKNLIDSDDIVFVAIHEGHSAFTQRSRTMTLQAGEVVMTSIGEPATFSIPVKTNVTNLRFKRALLSPYLVNLDDALSQPKLRQSPALDLLLNYMNVLKDSDALATPELRRSVVAHMHDLAALAIGATRDGKEIAQGRGLRAARLHAIKTYILENLGMPNLTLGNVALRSGISPRYVNLLFESEGMTFSEFVIGQRLEWANRILANPRHAERTISSIAFEAGFSDLSYFNRTYRRRFGMTPSDARGR
jgi:AraC-like DNA-binding protein